MQIEFNGQKYKVSSLVLLTGFGHIEDVDTKDITVVKGSEWETKHPIVYKYNNKTYLLAGTLDTTKDKVSVCVISKHTLKKALANVPTPVVSTPRPNPVNQFGYHVWSAAIHGGVPRDELIMFTATTSKPKSAFHPERVQRTQTHSEAQVSLAPQKPVDDRASRALAILAAAQAKCPEVTHEETAVMQRPTDDRAKRALDILSKGSERPQVKAAPPDHRAQEALRILEATLSRQA